MGHIDKRFKAEALVLDIETWLDNLPKPWGSGWFESPDRRLRIYVRFLSYLEKDLKVLEIGNVIINPRGYGIFTHMIAKIEILCARRQIDLHIENVLTGRFCQFFKKRGYTEVMERNFELNWRRLCNELSDYCFGYDKYGRSCIFDREYLDEQNNTIRERYPNYIRLTVVEQYYPLTVLERIYPFND